MSQQTQIETNSNEIDEQNIQSDESTKSPSQELTLERAMTKYYYPAIKKLQENIEQIKDAVLNNQQNAIKKSPMKHRAIKIIVKAILGIGMGLGLHVLCMSNFPSLTAGAQTALFAGLSAASFGALEGLHWMGKAIKDKIVMNKATNEYESLNAQLTKEIEMLNNINKHLTALKQLEEIADNENLVKTKICIAELNQQFYQLIKNMYGENLTPNLVNSMQKYETFANCHSNVQQIVEDLTLFKTELKNINPKPYNYPKSFAENGKNMLQSFRQNLGQLLVSTIIPFAQVINVATEKKTSIFEQKANEQMKLEQARKQQEFQAENEAYKQFFGEFGLDESLTQK